MDLNFGICGLTYMLESDQRLARCESALEQHSKALIEHKEHINKHAEVINNLSKTINSFHEAFALLSTLIIDSNAATKALVISKLDLVIDALDKDEKSHTIRILEIMKKAAQSPTPLTPDQRRAQFKVLTFQASDDDEGI
jgi:chromosome segregation ATPase